MTFDSGQQEKHRQSFIDACRQKAWDAACHADWIRKSLDEVVASYQKLQEQDRTLEADIKELAAALDSHTVDNRQKRKALQEKRDALAPQMQALLRNMQAGQSALNQLLQSTESALALATHAETWEWKEVEPKPAHEDATGG